MAWNKMGILFQSKNSDYYLNYFGYQIFGDIDFKFSVYTKTNSVTYRIIPNLFVYRRNAQINGFFCPGYITGHSSSGGVSNNRYPFIACPEKIINISTEVPSMSLSSSNSNNYLYLPRELASAVDANSEQQFSKNMVVEIKSIDNYDNKTVVSFSGEDLFVKYHKSSSVLQNDIIEIGLSQSTIKGTIIDGDENFSFLENSPSKIAIFSFSFNNNNNMSSGEAYYSFIIK